MGRHRELFRASAEATFGMATGLSQGEMGSLVLCHSIFDLSGESTLKKIEGLRRVYGGLTRSDASLFNCLRESDNRFVLRLVSCP